MDAAVAILGTCWAGAAYVPIGLNLPQDKILAIFAACDFRAIIVDQEGAKLLTDTVLAAGPSLLIRVDQMLESNCDSQSLLDALADPVQVHADHLA